MARYIQNGKTIDYPNTATKEIAYGDVVVLPTRIGVAAATIPAKDVGAVDLTGVYELPCAGEAIGFGDAVYWDATAGAITKTVDSNTPAGIAVEEKTGTAAGTLAVRIG